jgi:hypothetical protein
VDPRTSFVLNDRSAPADEQLLATYRPSMAAPDPLQPDPGVVRTPIAVDFAGRSYVLDALEHRN